MEVNPSLRFCANLKWLFTERPFLERFAAAAQAGFTAVEYASPYEYPAAQLRRQLEDHGLRQILINTPVGAPGTITSSGNASHPDGKAAFRRDLQQSVEYAQALGASVIHLMAGIVPPGVERAAAKEVYLENLAWAAGIAGPAGIKLVLEAVNQRDVPGFFLLTLEDGAEIIELIGSEHIRLLFDVYHCQVSQGDLSKRLEKLMPLVAHVQVADPPFRSEPGTGEIAWPWIFEKLTELDYRGWIGCEYRPLTNTEAGLDWLTRQTAKIATA